MWNMGEMQGKHAPLLLALGVADWGWRPLADQDRGISEVPILWI